MKSGPLEIARGGAQLLQFTDGHIRLWTGQVSMYVSANADPALIGQIVQELRGMNNTRQSGELLPPPDFSSCPPVDERLKQGPPGK